MRSNIGGVAEQEGSTKEQKKSPLELIRRLSEYRKGSLSSRVGWHLSSSILLLLLFSYRYSR